ncbi:MAG: bacterial Ig-like domain-containing protein, partial [Clostridia bacterium]|nr:bacterial Ig-like domain-containing protein [Clostridia bacterium]
MKKIRILLPVLLAALMLITMSFAAACKKKDSDADVTTELLSITLNTDNVKKEFEKGELFESEGLVVTATLKHSDKETPELKVLEKNEYNVDSSSFNSDIEGNYSIKVTYSYEGVRKEANYTVNVVAMIVTFEGLEVTLAEGTRDTYTLNMGSKSATIDVSKIVVKEVDENGLVIDEPITDYEVAIYNGAEKLEIPENNRVRVEEGGTYQIWASKPSANIPGYTLRGFVRVYVLNAMTKLEVTGEDAVFTQAAGRIDLVTPTWIYTLTYANGVTKTLNPSDVVIDGYNPKIGADSTEEAAKPADDRGKQEVTATYNSVNAKGEAEKIDCVRMVTVTGKYTPNKLEFNASEMMSIESGNKQDIIESGYYFTAIDSNENVIASPGKYGDESLGYILMQANSTDGSNLAVQTTNNQGNKVLGLDKTFSLRLDLAGTAKQDCRNIKLNLVGKAAVTVVAASNSGGNVRTLALYNEDFMPIDESFEADKIAMHTFEVSEAGTYYLGSMNSGMSVYYILIE